MEVFSLSYSEKMIEALQNGDVDESTSFLKQAIEKDTEDDLYLLADSLYQLGFLVETKEILEKLLKTNPEDDEIRINLAEIAIEEDEDLEAFDLLNQIDESSPAYVQALLALADYYQVHELPEVSEQKLLEAQKLMPDEPVITFALAELYYTMGRYRQAIRQYETLIADGYDEFAAVQINARLGAIYSGMGEFEQAVDYLQAAIDEKEDIDTIFQLGLTYFQQEEYARANENFNRVKTIDYSYTSVYPYLAKGLEEEQKIDEAAEVVSEGLFLDTTNSQLYIIGANIEVKRNNYEQAEEYFKEALKQNPDNESVRIEYSNFLNYIGEYEQSIDLIQNALKNEDADPQFYWNLASAQNELEEFEAAGSAFERAYPYFDNNKDFMKEYVAFLLEDGQIEKMKTMAEKYLVLEPNDIEISEMLRRFEEY